VSTCWIAVVAVVLLLLPAQARAQNRGAAAPQTPRAAAPIDLTGYWVSLITEDWRYRMVTPPKGDFQAVPMTPAAIKVAETWDPDADERAGLQCKSYGAAAVMRVPGRVRVTWQDDFTLRLETDNGQQVRLFRFNNPGARRPSPGKATWQGDSAAEWQVAGRGRGATGALKVVTTNFLPGYLRKNGVPYSANAGLTEYFDVAPLPGGGQVMVVTVAVNDPMYLDRLFVVTSQFKKEPDGSKWDPTPCSSTW
jgi:hypothetical protein